MATRNTAVSNVRSSWEMTLASQKAGFTFSSATADSAMIWETRA